MSAERDALIPSEVAKRRTFAIISHPDAGKTTLTEKVLLYCGAIREAGEVKAKAQRRKTTSDWMALEQQRGISVSSSVLQFEYRGLHVNLLDTPGHQDFSEDTYRTLMAADAAVMVIDAAKGVEAQTRKLFEVCRLRKIPIFTFVNKMDREGRHPFELLEELQKILNIDWNPLTWPVGMGPSFKGVYHRIKREFQFFTPAEKAGQRAGLETLKCEPNSPELLKYVDAEQQKTLIDEIDLLEGAVGPFDREAFLRGELTPAVFGSARNNFGVLTFLDIFADLAPGPSAKDALPAPVQPDEKRFSGFVFKIQANMDKAHRDRIAFLRLCSGRFERDMDVKHARLGKTIRLSHAKQFMAQDRTTVNEAFGGDIVGIHDPGHFKIGDTVFTGPAVKFEGIPQFSPESFGRVRLRDPLKRKQLQKGIEQLSEEGLVQLFIEPHVGLQDPILGVVGSLQFDVMMFRLKDEYNVDATLDRMPYTHANWIVCHDPKLDIRSLDWRVPLVKDAHDHWVALCQSEWELNYIRKNAPDSVQWYPNSFAAELAVREHAST
ncbi:MAG: peptide chain release factor 3 [Bdellovibrionales bacterium]|nr:peptide chain release factor 3 [Bdellovibrionales bacterium]